MDCKGLYGTLRAGTITLGKYRKGGLEGGGPGNNYGDLIMRGALLHEREWRQVQ